MSVIGWEAEGATEERPTLCHLFLLYSITFINQISLTDSLGISMLLQQRVSGGDLNYFYACHYHNAIT